MDMRYTDSAGKLSFVSEAELLVMGNSLWALNDQGQAADYKENAKLAGEFRLFGRVITSFIMVERLWLGFYEKHIDLLACLENGIQAHMQIAHKNDYVVGWKMEDGELDRVIQYNEE